jgi:GntR family transcriptional repressor for pyruvate dehydrogenase complex
VIGPGCRNSLREAVKALSLIAFDVRRDGPFVTSLEPHLLLEAMAFVVSSPRRRRSSFRGRRILEPGRDGDGTSHTSGSRTARGDARRRRAEHLVEDLVAHDVTFHGLIAELSGNTYLSTLLESLTGRTLRARIWRGMTEDRSVERTLAEHRGIVDAMIARNVDMVQAWTTVHISGVESWLARAIET